MHAVLKHKSHWACSLFREHQIKMAVEYDMKNAVKANAGQIQ